MNAIRRSSTTLSTRTPRPAVLVLAVFALLLSAAPSPAAPPYPNTFNFYGRNYFEPGDIANLAKYDVIALDVDAPDSILVQIRARNPSIRILAYLPINGTWANAQNMAETSYHRYLFTYINASDWWLWNTNGGHVSDHPAKWTFNTTELCPRNPHGQTFLDWFPDFIKMNVLQNGLSQWDGVFLDNVWTGIWFINQNTTLNPYPIDADRNGIADTQPVLDDWWEAGTDTLISRITRNIPPGKLLVGNGQNPFWETNGTMIETFPFKGQPELGHPLGYSWTSSMFGTYGYFDNEDHYEGVPRINVLNTKWSEGDRYNPVRSPEYGRRKRFVIGSTMLRDGYVSIDIGQPSGGGHYSIWWEDEYDKPIGSPLGAPYQAVYNGTTLWRRDYTNGSVILNNNWTTFLGSPDDRIPPISYCDAAILLNDEFWDPLDDWSPAAITDLHVTRTWEDRVEIAWTNVGDNDFQGQAYQIEARWSKQTITGPKWSRATVAAEHPVPALPGLTQTMIVPGLGRDQQYHFAVKTRDMKGNWSAVSNDVAAVTLIGDTTAPAPVTDLQVLSTTPTKATVRWTATGDDGNAGTATSFDLRYALFPITTSNMNSASAVTGEPAPGPPGTVHTLTLLGMIPNRTYWFMIRVGDEQPNWSPLSNIPFAMTQPGDSIAPAAITDLHVVGVEPNAVTLRWTAPGDDGMTGQANQYDMRYATYPITANNWDGTNFVIGEPGPLAAGETQTFRVSGGLGTGYLYYFAMKTADEWPNWSTISNTTWALTSLVSGADAAPPARLELGPAAPNPTSGTARIDYALPDAADVTIEVHDVRGRRIAVLLSGRVEAGRRSVDWNGTDDAGRPVASGVYFVRLEAGRELRHMKVLVSR